MPESVTFKPNIVPLTYKVIDEYGTTIGELRMGSNDNFYFFVEDDRMEVDYTVLRIIADKLEALNE
jgi:hypothetical protein